MNSMEDTMEQEEILEEEKIDKKKKKEKKNKFEEENLELKNKVSELEDKLIRTQAEMVNYRRRKDEETARLLEYSNEDIAKDLLPILDNFERAINMDNDNLEDEVSKFLEGFKIIHKGLKETLQKYEVIEINPIDEEFDPNYHNAVMTENNEAKADNIVTEVFQKGYMLKTRVIRPAMVKVNQNEKKVNEKKGDNNE
ncbi:MAG: nucleotide exchange factor GrpE [Firmicutes bacterium]|nr:nucleotide exchange factor GrpE [Bacillota bacterium]